MKKAFLFVLIFMTFFVSSCSYGRDEAQLKQDESTKQQAAGNERDKAAIKSLVEGFGAKLQAVSLQAPKEIRDKSIRENYGSFISPQLMAKWVNDPDPVDLPGRVTSSPWPDRIDILNMEKVSEDAYKVTGEIAEITSQEKVAGGIAAKRPVILMVEKIGDRWLINTVTLGAYEATSQNPIIYKNPQYGFSFSLPPSWKGYSIITDKWNGFAPGGAQGGQRIVETGPIISIRHPLWTEQNRRQDIPIMVFTLAQWESLQRGKFITGAAPVPPSELGRNSSYVLALPPRYNYAFPPGYKEVEDILRSHPLKTGEKS